MIVTKDKWDQLLKRLKALNIQEADLAQKFILGSGAGGQKINKTHSCVYLKHLPTGIQIKCQSTRSRSYNHYLALTELCDRLEKQASDALQEKIHLKEKIRRQNKKRSFSGQQDTLKAKKLRAIKKTFRAKFKPDD